MAGLRLDSRDALLKGGRCPAPCREIRQKFDHPGPSEQTGES